MDINVFNEFCTLARELNFREAAQKLHVSLPALSRHIAALESQYNVALFTRDKHSVHLTDAGAFLLDYAESIWGHFQQSQEHMERLFAGEHHLRLSGVIGNPSLYGFIRQAEQLFHEANPLATLHIERNTSPLIAGQVEELRADNADGALIYCSCFDEAAYSDIDHMLVGKLPMALAVRREHPLAKERLINRDMLNGGCFVQFVGPDFSPHFHAYRNLLEKADITFTVAPVPADSEYDVVRSVDNMGLKLYLVPGPLVLPAVAANPDIVIIPISTDVFTLNLELLSLKGHRTPLIDLAGHCLAEAFQSFLETLNFAKP